MISKKQKSGKKSICGCIDVATCAFTFLSGIKGVIYFWKGILLITSL
jgi:hypothetical protein